ncbi:hypothetical protein [Flavobacterium terrisoli]|uniref:hypothetical protein n=1 Tax=Flavobacterium terrisoli TaxID=3242195 RepID=UPI002542E6DB|nr:hypothetical protein [Flavobacterium buctense]
MKNIASAFLCLIAITSCNSYSITDNKEPIFNNYKPDSKEYKNKLAEKIQSNPDNLTYIFERYIDATHIEVLISGTDFSAKGLVQVKDWKGIEGIKEAEGGGYSGAELKGLQLDIIGNPSGAQLIFTKIDYIID